MLALDDDTFRQMARVYPVVSPLRELRHSLGEMRLFSDLAVGSDGRNRCLLSAFRSITGRNQPSNARFIFGPSCWLRSLIQPGPGRALAYCDWSQQEFGIAAALSGDRAMMDAYTSGDPYLSFAKQARAVPADATKESHPRERELFKVCALAVQYGMGSQSLALSLDRPEVEARELLRLHRQTYSKFWEWSSACVNHAMLLGWLDTVFGWRVHVGPKANPRSLANFPMQANGAEMLRLACCLATERKIQVKLSAPIAIERQQGKETCTISEALDKMIGVSDNEATTALANHVGYDAINALPKRLGITGLSDQILPRPGILDRVLDKRVYRLRVPQESDLLPQHGTARGIVRYFELVHKNELLNESTSQGVLEVLDRHPKPFAPRATPANFSSGGKGGGIGWVRPFRAQYNMGGWGLLIRNEEVAVGLCLWCEWFPKAMSQEQQREWLSGLSDCIVNMLLLEDSGDHEKEHVSQPGAPAD